MFFYISFLRPPPLQVSPSGSISVTPQVANDLRTEPFDGAQDIFYSWTQSRSPATNLNSPSNVGQITTKPLKLTTWRLSNAYKEIPVPLPPDVRDGQSWHLVLSAQAQTQPYIIDLQNDTLGKRPFPVISMPIFFVSRSAKASGKQEQIERVYKFPVGPDKDVVFVTVTEQTSFDLDKKIWDSGVGLSSWLLDLGNDNAEAVASTPLVALKDALFSMQRRNILELGAGTGIVALTLGALRSAIVPPEANDNSIITTDLPSAMPLLEHNIAINRNLFSSTPPEAATLDWDDEELPNCVQITKEGFDAIVMADVTYNTASFPSLIRTLSKLIRLGSKPPLLLLGYKERDPAERTLWEMASDIGILFEKVAERSGAGGTPVEVWLGRVVIGVGKS